jgi:hypothetical protein
MTWLRTFLGLSPDWEEGTKRQKHGDVILEALPQGFVPSSLADGMGRVVSAVVASGVPIHPALLTQLASVGIEIQSAHDRGIFLEDLVPLYVPANPETVTSRNERVVVTGGFARIAQYVAAQQVFHAGDGLGDGVAPSTD